MQDWLRVRLPQILGWVIAWTVFAFLPLTFLAYNQRFLRAVSPTRSRFGRKMTGFFIFVACIVAMCVVEEYLESAIRLYMSNATKMVVAAACGVLLFILFIAFSKRLAK